MKRLFDDPGVPSQVRADLLHSRRAAGDYDAVTKLPQLRAALTDPSRQPLDESTLADGQLSSAGRMPWPQLHVAPWTWKLVLLTAIGAGAIFAAWPSRRDPQSEPPPPVKQQPAAAAASAPTVTNVEPAAQTSAPARVDLPAPALPVASPSSRREIDQLVRIRALLERDPTAAYRLAQRSEREFPHGVLSEERQALQVVALAKSGATDAAARRAQQFYVRYPESPLRELLEAALHP